MKYETALGGHARDVTSAPSPLTPVVDRRRFLTYALAAPTLTIGGRWLVDPLAPESASASETTVHSPTVSDFYDTGDALAGAAAPTMPLLMLEITEDNRARFALPRMEVGQGLVTTVAMIIAEELDFPLDRVEVTLEEARPELIWNQITAGSSGTRVLYDPVSRMASAARQRTLEAATAQWRVPRSDLVTNDGIVTASDGRTATFGSFSLAAASINEPLAPAPKPVSQQRVLGTRRTRVDAREIVTGQKRFALDLDIPGARPAVSLHAPQVRGTLRSFDNEAAIRSMPGVLDVAVIRAMPTAVVNEHPAYAVGGPPTAIVILAETVGQALAAQDAVRATWNAGTNAGRSDAYYRKELRQATPPLVPPAAGQRTVDGEFDFAFVPHAPLETVTAVANVDTTGAEVWSGLQIPTTAQQEIADAIGLQPSQVTVHVVPAGGSFGRRLFADGALEAAIASKAFRRPVKLMWSRAEDTKHGRLRPATHHKVRATIESGSVVSFEHRLTSGFTLYSHGFGDALTSVGAHNPAGNYLIAQSIFPLMMTMPYNFGATSQTLNEVDFKLNTGSWRGVYTGTGRTVEEIVIDEIAAVLGVDPVEFRLRHLKDRQSTRVLQWVATTGRWGRRMPPGHAQGIAINVEHRSAIACLVEINARPAVPRVTKAVMACDAGIPMNPSGLEAQMLGHLTDGISTVLRASVHIDDGAVRESSYRDFLYARQVDSPPEVVMHVFPGEDGNQPGGAGETGVAACAAAVANAYGRATDTTVRSFPINH